MDWSNIWPIVVAVGRALLVALLGALGDGAILGGRVGSVGEVAGRALLGQ